MTVDLNQATFCHRDSLEVDQAQGGKLLAHQKWNDVARHVENCVIESIGTIKQVKSKLIIFDIVTQSLLSKYIS